MNKKILLTTAFVVSLLMVGILNTSIISAQDSGVYPTIIERLSERFGLNKDEVKNVFEEVRDEHKADMFANWAERLDDLVAEGKITEVQKQAILDKHVEMESKMEELKDLAPEERHTKMREIHEEMKKWTEEQGIEIPFMIFKPGFHRGFKGGLFNEKLN